ncbi:unnamed protein product [Prorocentrum cordatum]|uniref:Uncharacterized protein n=2 Tax=Prorocentrum cordatum TaxID=2364126 RepID=A0ABN9VJY1_9DINO|nr:unnamed protein product [Polarella glacialis]
MRPPPADAEQPMLSAGHGDAGVPRRGLERGRSVPREGAGGAEAGADSDGLPSLLAAGCRRRMCPLAARLCRGGSTTARGALIGRTSWRPPPPRTRWTPAASAARPRTGVSCSTSSTRTASAGPGRGSCYRYKGECESTFDSCWRLFAMTSPGQARSSSEQPGASGHGGSGEDDADDEASATPPVDQNPDEQPGAGDDGGTGEPDASSESEQPGVGDHKGSGEADADDDVPANPPLDQNSDEQPGAVDDGGVGKADANGESSSALPPLVTTLLKAAKGGDSVLEVMELEGFSVGDTVRLEAVGTQEDCKVGSLQRGSMILRSPLASNYPVGASVTLVAHSPCDGQGRLGLASVLEFVPGKSFGNVSELCRCALVGSSSALLERADGEQIDSYDTVIRINRIPRGQIQRSLGSKTDVFFLNKQQALLEHVQLMTLEDLLQGSGDVPPTASCGELDNCRNAAIVQKGGNPSLQELVERHLLGLLGARWARPVHRPDGLRGFPAAVPGAGHVRLGRHRHRRRPPRAARDTPPRSGARHPRRDDRWEAAAVDRLRLARGGARRSGLASGACREGPEAKMIGSDPPRTAGPLRGPFSVSRSVNFATRDRSLREEALLAISGDHPCLGLPSSAGLDPVAGARVRDDQPVKSPHWKTLKNTPRAVLR